MYLHKPHLRDFVIIKYVNINYLIWQQYNGIDNNTMESVVVNIVRKEAIQRAMHALALKVLPKKNFNRFTFGDGYRPESHR